MRVPIILSCVFLLLSCNQPEKSEDTREDFLVYSFEDLIPNKAGEVLLNEKWISPKAVRSLRFADSGLNNFEIKGLPDELKLFTNLEYLWIGMRGFKELPEVVLSLTNLRELDLQHSNIRTLPPEVSKLKHLEELILLGSHIETLPMELAQLKKLHYIHLGMIQSSTIIFLS